MNEVMSPSLGVMQAYKRRAGNRHCVGDGRKMTVREISQATGCDASAIYARIQHGWKGSDLLRPYRQKLFDCGGQMLTIKQIMQATGLSEAAVRARIARGKKGKALLRKERKNVAAPRSSTMVIACRIADEYPDRLPTTKEIRELYPMAAQSAERWLTALREARKRA